MGEYHEARGELKSLIVSLLRADAVAGGHPPTPQLDAALSGEAETTLTNFERVAIAHQHRSIFWSGVWQSFVGSVLFLLALTLFALLAYGFKQNPFKVLTDDALPRPIAAPSSAP